MLVCFLLFLFWKLRIYIFVLLKLIKVRLSDELTVVSDGAIIPHNVCVRVVKIFAAH